ncbi:Ca-activated chloride channel family protein [Kutzneria viridogrisea]|uniref:Ca-activated chloride channel family protein n=1 Tax=Kutzneria viridogrisea TaxID=47990 RepID=A0ABR6BC70_9PSEU|nr:Ca-activated chloride channel family protein [Kutzneria viridogrisea]
MTGLVGIDGFSTPLWFALLAVILAVFGTYFWRARRRRRHVVRFANLPLLEQVAPTGSYRWRHVPPVLFLVAFVLLTVALAGPQAQAKVPRNRATVMLVIDVSPSMEATDIRPSRIKAAQGAAKDFVQNMTEGINLGLVTFGGSATVDVSPTTARKPVTDAIDNIKLQPATATGEAIAAALQAIQQFEKGLGGPSGAPPARIVLMSDGKQTAGRDEFAMAKQCKEGGIPISTISYGTSDGVVDLEGQQVPVPVDDESLHELADMSGGEFYKADTSDKLREIYQSLGEQIGYETQQTDVSKPFVALGALATITAAGAALLVSQRLP